MKIEISKNWCVNMAGLESDDDISAGLLALPSYLISEQPHSDEAEEHHIAFGRLVRLMRRSKGFSVEKLAEDAGVDLGELVDIEDDSHFRPGIRTVYQLANVFGLPSKNLLMVAGLVEAKNDSLYEEAVKFAARSEPNAELSPEEKAALEAFVAVLAKE